MHTYLSSAYPGHILGLSPGCCSRLCFMSYAGLILNLHCPATIHDLAQAYPQLIPAKYMPSKDEHWIIKGPPRRTSPPTAAYFMRVRMLCKLETEVSHIQYPHPSIHPSIHAYMHAYIRTNTHTHTQIHTCMPACVHTYIT